MSRNFLNITYQKASISDWDNLANFRNVYSGASFDTDYQHFEQDFIETHKRNISVLFVAKKSDQIVGYARCGQFKKKKEIPIYGMLEEVPDGFYLKGILTDDSVRGQGVGKKLTILRHDWVRERSEEIYCILDETNSISLRFHLDIGYKVVHTKLNYQKIKGNESGLLLRYDLKTEKNNSNP